MRKNFSDISLLRLHPEKPTIKNSKFFSFSLDIPDIPSINNPLSLADISDSPSENYITRDTRSRRQPMKDYRFFIAHSQISASRKTNV